MFRDFSEFLRFADWIKRKPKAKLLTLMKPASWNLLHEADQKPVLLLCRILISLIYRLEAAIVSLDFINQNWNSPLAA